MMLFCENRGRGLIPDLHPVMSWPVAAAFFVSLNPALRSLRPGSAAAMGPNQSP
jgi:hypothetical protein